MPNTNTYTMIGIFIIALVTFGTRVVPFLLFRQDKAVPKFIEYIGTYLPPAVMAMLIIYSVRNVEFNRPHFGAPEILAVFTVAIVHLWKNNYLFSIFTGTITYMILVQFIF
ncbi:AzlD domain-containing protein [Alkalicella caledoniensis]|uniref:AzlD domain-containing protein n=1 Tax=Alkalicella caledoniensis TaxID=2731377 RepID=A0A7G9W7M4_ALKCA|nr:AzlD domain-containing protein [Alkalicella caledoniensis]QNO14686.1 AzlD domain-containing protein [Alkalicella caledoniensis]